ncbi:tetratricopeptide repeat protein [Nostoc sp.]|uniref:tetratricopeptide repeat protein n=1 Tax=Nostoc sp. TaxID=1180 RepID=UPI002FF6145C
MNEQNLLEQGIDYFNQEKYESAIEALNQALQTNPNLAEAYYLRGVARRKLGDAQGAVDDYTQA